MLAHRKCFGVRQNEQIISDSLLNELSAGNGLPSNERNNETRPKRCDDNHAPPKPVTSKSSVQREEVVARIATFEIRTPSPMKILRPDRSGGFINQINPDRLYESDGESAADESKATKSQAQKCKRGAAVWNWGPG